MASPFDSSTGRVWDAASGRETGVSGDDARSALTSPDRALGANFGARRCRDIVFSVKRKVWRQDDERMEPDDADYAQKRQARMAAGGYRCVFCGFRSQHTELHHRNDNHADPRDENLEVADPLCHGTQHIGQIGAEKHGIFVQLEGMPQAELNHLQRTIAVVLEIGSDAEKADARALLQHLASRSQLVTSAWGSANPSDFATALHALHEEDSDKRVGAFASLALLYRPARFAQYVRRWVDETYRSLPIATWKHLYERARSGR